MEPMKKVYDMNEKEVGDLVQDSFDLLSPIFNNNYTTANLVNKMMSSDYDGFEYFGDKYLVMDEFWHGLKDEHRLVLLGPSLPVNVLHYYYGKYKEMMLAMGSTIAMYEEQKVKGFTDVAQSGVMDKAPSNLYT